jgi:hypothetical protein
MQAITIVSIALKLVPTIARIAKATKKKSAGGKKITAEEWAEIAQILLEDGLPVLKKELEGAGGE